MCELFGLDENHNGISIPSTVKPGYSFEFYIGGVMRFVTPDRGRYDTSLDLEFCEPYGYPPTDVAIAGAMYALANETDYARRTNVINMREWVTDPN